MPKHKMNRQNKRGDVTVTILVIGVFLVCALAILTFYISDRNVKKDFDVLNSVEVARLVGDKTVFYENLGYNTAQINEMLGIKEENGERYYETKQLSAGKEMIYVRYNLP